MPAATGFVVAGGRSARMGLDKALLPWGDGTLLDHALRRLQAVCGEARILSGPEPRYVDRGVPVITDIVKNAGPLAGIHAGLLHLDAPAGLFLAVDVPLVPSVVLAALLRASDGHDAAVPVVNGQPEPLCAVYRQSCREQQGASEEDQDGLGRRVGSRGEPTEARGHAQARAFKHAVYR